MPMCSRGRAYDARRYVMAIAQYSAALAQQPKDWAALYYRCPAWFDAEDYQAAIWDCTPTSLRSIRQGGRAHRPGKGLPPRQRL